MRLTVALLLSLFGVSTFTPTPAAALTPTLGPTRTATPTPRPVDPPPLRMSLEVFYRSSDASATDNEIRPYIVLHNASWYPVDLASVTLRYWYTRDGAQGQTSGCISADRGCANVTETIGTLSSPVSLADSYLEIGFKPGAGTLEDGARSIAIESQITRGDGASYDETNDYSYNTREPGRLYFWPSITVYYKGEPVKNYEPFKRAPGERKSAVSLSVSRVDIGGTVVVSASTNLYFPWYSLRIVDASTGQSQDESNPIVTSAEPSGAYSRTPTGGASWTLTAVRPGAVQVQVLISGDFYWPYCGCVTTVWGSRVDSEWLAVGGAPKPTATPTATPTQTPTPTVPSVPDGVSLKVQYKVNDGSATDNQIKPGLRVLNTGTAAVALSDITLRYWYTRDGSQGQTYTCDYAVAGCSNVVGTISAFANPTSTADHYLQIGFKSTAGNLAPGASSGEIQSRLNKTDWSSYNETNDYSYGGTQTSFADWSKVTVYYQGRLVWGTEPSSARPTNTPTTTPTSTPRRACDFTAGEVTIFCTPTPTHTPTPTSTRTSTPTATACAGGAVSAFCHEITPTYTPTYTPTPTKTPTPVTPTLPGALPDLAVSSIDISSETNGCPSGPWRLRVTVANLGDADGGPFAVTLNGMTQTVPGLAARQSTWVWFDYVYRQPSTAAVDSANQVQESNESNNGLTSPLYIPTQPYCPTPTPLGGTLRVQYRAANTSAGDNQVRPHFNIVNIGSSAVALSELTVRYWYTVDGDKAQSFACDYAIVGCANVRGQVVKLGVPRSGADYYLEVTFTGSGGIDTGGQTGEIQTRLNKADWSNYSETDDYSFDPTKTAFADWSKVTLYRNGVLVWGTEP